MNGIRRPAVILADSMEEYMATPDPYKNPPKSKLNIFKLGEYAERVGKDFSELTAEEILQFKNPKRLWQLPICVSFPNGRKERSP